MKDQNICNKIMFKFIQNYSNIFQIARNAEGCTEERPTPIIVKVLWTRRDTRCLCLYEIDLWWWSVQCTFNSMRTVTSPSAHPPRSVIVYKYRTGRHNVKLNWSYITASQDRLLLGRLVWVSACWFIFAATMADVFIDPFFLAASCCWFKSSRFWFYFLFHLIRT